MNEGNLLALTILSILSKLLGGREDSEFATGDDKVAVMLPRPF